MSKPSLYDLLLLLDRLEALREDLLALRGDADDADVDEAAVRSELAALDLRSLTDVEGRIAQLNAHLDEREEEERDA